LSKADKWQDQISAFVNLINVLITGTFLSREISDQKYKSSADTEPADQAEAT
jgi:hypothetical protein